MHRQADLSKHKIIKPINATEFWLKFKKFVNWINSLESEYLFYLYVGLIFFLIGLTTGYIYGRIRKTYRNLTLKNQARRENKSHGLKRRPSNLNFSSNRDQHIFEIESSIFDGMYDYEFVAPVNRLADNSSKSTKSNDKSKLQNSTENLHNTTFNAKVGLATLKKFLNHKSRKYTVSDCEKYPMVDQLDLVILQDQQQKTQATSNKCRPNPTTLNKPSLTEDFYWDPCLSMQGDNNQVMWNPRYMNKDTNQVNFDVSRQAFYQKDRIFNV